MSISARTACFGIVGMMLATPAAAQSLRDTVAAAGLGPGYAHMLNLAATPDLSAAH